MPPPPCRSVCLDCIVTVVDGRHVERQLGAPRPAGAINEAQQQVAFADVVLLNKVRAAAGRAQEVAGTQAAVAALRRQADGLSLI